MRRFIPISNWTSSSAQPLSSTISLTFYTAYSTPLAWEMVVKSFTDEQLNFFKFSIIVVDEFPKALRQTFKYMWENVGPGSNWDDSEAVRDSFLTKEGGKTKVPTDKSYEKWDCTALFQATIYAQTFALPDSKGKLTTLSEWYVKPRPITHGSFHTSVVSPSGNKAETFAFAIDQLRLLRTRFVIRPVQRWTKNCLTITLSSPKMRSKLLEYQQTRLMPLEICLSLTSPLKRLPGWRRN